MLSHYNKTQRELRDDPKRLCEYLAFAAPYLMAYDSSKNKNDIFKEYMTHLDGGVIVENNFNIETTCVACGATDFYYDDSTSDLICTSCGVTDYQSGKERGYKEEQDTSKVAQYSYKRENHFNEWLLQFQAREVTNIPPSVFEEIRSEFKRNRKTKYDINDKIVKSTLKKLKLTRYYEHIPYITSILSGVSPPIMTADLEDKLRHMFYLIQEPFYKNKPEDRKNFLSYSYILYKFCELLSEDSFLPCFPLLKSKEKLLKQDLIWKEICKELKWEFIPTV
jgi:hypothetical protein